MRLFEAIVNANHRALAGDKTAGLHPAEFPEELPVVALTCIDPRLNRFFPGVLGLPEEQFIWLRNAGNIITSPTSSTMRSLAMACAVKQGREIAVIGHSDCHIRQTTVSGLLDRLIALGIRRDQLPDNLTEFFGLFASEQQNVIRSVEHVRSSPLIGPKIPIHGLMVDIGTGKLDWIVNGYEALDRPVALPPPGTRLPELGNTLAELGAGADFNMGEMKFPESKIGDVPTGLREQVAQAAQVVQKVRVTEAKNPPPVARAPIRQSVAAPPPVLPKRKLY